MSLDALAIAAIRQDLGERILHARIDRICQPSRGDLVFFLRKGINQYRLYFSSDTPSPWLGLVTTVPANPPAAPAFCMLLRKYLAGGRLLQLRQPPFERQLSLVVEHYGEAAGLAQRTLHLELIGRRGNAILADADGRILDALWRTPAESPRPLEPGAAYAPPPSPGRLNPEHLAEATLANLLAYAPPEQSLAALLQTKLLGFSPATTRGVIAAAGLSLDQTAGSLEPGARGALWAALAGLAGRVRAGEFAPRLVRNSGGRPVDLLGFPSVPAPEYSQEPVASAAEAAGLAFGSEAQRQRMTRLRTGLLARVQKALQRADRKRRKQEAELTAAGDADLHRARGDLILAHLAGIPKGITEIELPSPLDPAITIKIPLDPALSASANAQAHFRRYQRAKRGRTAIAAQLARTGEEMAYLNGLSFSLAAAETQNELREIAAEMAVEGLAPKVKEPPARDSGPRRYRSLDGLEILVGRNNRQNEEVTFHLSGPGDTWLHAREIPGAHVIVRRAHPGSLPPSTLLDAANLAVYHSQARTSAKVPVDYTERRHVRKRPGGRPGLVNYDRFQTAIIDPSPKILARLLAAVEQPSARPKWRE